MKYLSRADLIFPPRQPWSKKGDHGRVLIIGGSKEYVGSLALAGLAALRAGCDWVTIAAPSKAAWAINALSPDLVTYKLSGDYLNLKHLAKLIKLSRNYQAILIGNGLGLKLGTKKLVRQLVKKFPQPLVLDADSLKSIKIKNGAVSSGQNFTPLILTPHQKEFEIFSGKSLAGKNLSERARLVQQLAGRNVIILKGPIDIIAYKNQLAFNKTGNPGMAKAGTGDVLAGLAAGFLAQGLAPYQATVNATYINGALGDILLKKKKGYSFIASDLVNDRQLFKKSFKALKR